MRIVKKNRFKNLGELHKEWTEAGVKASKATTHRRVKEFVVVRGVLPGLRRRTGLLPSGPNSFSGESKFCISFGNQGPRVWRKGGEAHSTSCLKSSVKFPQSVVIWGAMSSAGFDPLCFLKTNITCFLLLTSFLKMLISFPAGLGTCPHCQKHQKLVKWPWCWCAWLASKLTRPELHRESMGYCQEENEKQETKKCRWA